MNLNYWDRVSRQRLSRRKALAGVAASGASAAILAACGGGDDSDESEDSAGSGSSGTPQAGGRFAYHMSQIANYNPISNSIEGYYNAGVSVYDRPITVRGDGTGAYTLEAMEKIELAEPTRLVMTLKPGMVFQNKAPVNGRKVLASDVAASQNYVKTLPNAQDSSFQRTFVDRIEAPNENTVVFYLKSPLAYLFSSTYLANPTGQPIMPVEMLEVLDSTPAVGSGPFELVDHTFNQKYSYKKFEGFREAKKGMPYFAQREMFVITDPVAQEAAFRSGQINEWVAPTAIVDRLQTELDSTKFAQATFPNLFLTGTVAMMNAELGGPRPWHDIRVREALYRLTNKQQWVDLGFRGRAVVNTAPLPVPLKKWLMDEKAAAPFYKEDLQKANQLLTAANYDKSKEWEIICVNQSYVPLAEIWQQQVSRAGFKVRPVMIPTAEATPKKLFPGLYDFRIGGVVSNDTPVRALRYNHTFTAGAGAQGLNYGLYNKEIDALIEKSETEPNDEENIKLVKEIQKRVLDQYTMSYNIVTDTRSIFYDARLQDYVVDPELGQDYQYKAWFKA